MANSPFHFPDELRENRIARGSVEEDIVAINDVVLKIPPSQMSVYKESLNHEFATLRSAYTQKIKSGYGNAIVNMSVMFVGQDEVNTKLKRLVAGLRATPFCVCYSVYLQSLLRGLEVVEYGSKGDYFFFRPLALALRSITIATVPQAPDSLTVSMEFSWFNYFPYMREWVYRVGEVPFGKGTVFHSELWKAFYQPFFSETEVKWPHDINVKTPPAQIFFREYMTSPRFDAKANAAATDLLALLKRKPKEVQDLLNKFLKQEDVQWSDQNIWDVFWKKVGRDALIQGKDVDEAMRQRFQQSVVPDGAVTSVLESAGVGDLLRLTARQAYNLDTHPKYRNDENEIDKAIRELTKRQEEIRKFEQRLPTSKKSEDSSEYVPLPQLTVTHDYEKKGGVSHTAQVFGRKRKVILDADHGIVIESMSITMSYNLASIPMMAYRYPTIQFTGGVDVDATIIMNCSNEGAARINTAYDILETMSHRYRMVPQGYQNIWIQNDFLNLLGFKEFLTKKIHTETIGGQPGRSQVILLLTHAPVLANTPTGDPEKLNQEALWTTEKISLSIVNRLADFSVRTDARQSIDPKDITAYLLQPKMDPNDEKQKALATLVQKYCTAYNEALQTTFKMIFLEPMTVNNLTVKMLAAQYKEEFGQAPLYSDQHWKDYIAQKQQAARDAAAWRQQEGVSADFSIESFAFFMGLKEQDVLFGLLPSIYGLQNAVVHLENAKRGAQQNSLLPGMSGSQAGTDAAARALNHVKRLRGIGITVEANQAAKSVAKAADQFEKAFSYLYTYKASLKKLTDEIQLHYLELPEFQGIAEAIHKSDVIQKSSMAYKDFQPQLEGAVGLIRQLDPGAEANLTLYNPDLYLYNAMTDSPLVSVEDRGLLNEQALTRAKQLSLESYQNAKASVNDWFQNNYFSSLGSNEKNQKPIEQLRGHVDADASLRNMPTSSYYQHSIYSEASWNNTLTDGSLDKNQTQKVPIVKRITVDNTAKAFVNQASQDQLSSANQCTHTTDFTKMWGGIEVGGPGNSQSFDSSQMSTPDYFDPSKVPDQPASKDDVVAIIKKVSLEVGVNPDDMLKIAQYESALNPNARNPSGASGLYQIMPAIAQKLGINPFDAEQSARYTATQLKKSGKSGYDYYLEHNQGAGGASAIRDLAAGKKVSTKLTRTVEYNMVNQGIMLDVVANDKIRAMPKKTKEDRLKYQQALVDEARRRYTPQQLAKLFLERQQAHYANTKVRGGSGRASPGGAGSSMGVAAPAGSSSVATDVTSTVVAPLTLAHKEFERELYTGQALGLVRAYPAFKLFFIEDDQGEHRLGFDDFFNYSAVQSIRVVRDRHIAADLCEIYLTNISGVLSNRKFKQEEKPELARDEQGRKIEETRDPSKVGTDKENPIASLMLQEGTHFSVYMGYSNRQDNMELVFTGVITELEFAGSEEVVRILGQSYGIELVQDLKGITKPETTDNMSIPGFDFWGIGGNAYTGDLLEEMISQPEVLHFGRWSALRQYKTPERDLLTNKWQWRPRPQDDNIFAPTPKQNLREFADGIVFQELRYTIYQTTIWDIFQEMTLRHPNYIAAAVPYREIGNDRMTMFFGLPNQLYFSRDPNLQESNAVAAMNRKREELEDKLAKIRQKNPYGQDQYINPQSGIGHLFDRQTGRQYKSQEERIAHYNELVQAGAKPTQEVRDNLSALLNDRLAYAKESGYIRPFRRYHLLTSSYHIVSNNIQANTRDVANTVTVRYNKNLPGKDDIIEGVNNSDVAIANADEEVTVKLDAALPDEEMRTLVTSFLNVSNPNLARRYALGLLLRNTKNTYKGELVILGNPSIKPHDVCYLFDEYNDMIGPVEVDRVIHFFTPDQGFLTEIKPAMVAQAGEWTQLHSVTAMGVVMEGAVKHMFGGGATSNLGQIAQAGISLMAPVAGALFDYFGGFTSQTILNYTQFGFPLVMSPLSHRGRVFAGGIPTHKLPKSMWKCIFGDWTPQAQEGFDMWLEDKIGEIMGTLKTAVGKNTQGNFWNNANTLDVL